MHGGAHTFNAAVYAMFLEDLHAASLFRPTKNLPGEWQVFVETLSHNEKPSSSLLLLSLFPSSVLAFQQSTVA